MLDLVKKYFSQFSFLQNSDLMLLLSIARILKVKKGEVVVRAGEMNSSAFLVLHGLLRTYVVNHKAEEITVLLAAEGEMSGSSSSILLGTPSTETIEAVEDCILVLLDSHKGEELVRRHPRLLRLQNTLLKSQLAKTVDRVYFNTAYSPEERFIKFRNENPKLIQRVPQKYLASLLGMTTVSMSRIKSRLAGKSR